MADQNQDFITYQGDDVSPIFTVRDTDGAVVNISTVSQITWSARRNLDTTAAVTKTKTGGGITFVTTGTDGQFQVVITHTDTAALTGYYLHTASITDASGNITTVTVGRMQVGQAPTWSYDPTILATSDLYQARFLIGDTLEGDQQLTDSEIQFCLDSYSNVYSGAAQAARNIASKYARKVDISQGELRTQYSQQARNYRALAIELETRGQARGGVLLGVYAGGISVEDKRTQEQDADRVTPQFNLNMDVNLMVPVPPVGNETPDNPGSGNV